MNNRQGKDKADQAKETSEDPRDKKGYKGKNKSSDQAPQGGAKLGDVNGEASSKKK